MLSLSYEQKLSYSRRIIEIYDRELSNGGVRGHAEAMYLAFYYGIDRLFRENPMTLSYYNKVSENKALNDDLRALNYKKV